MDNAGNIGPVSSQVSNTTAASTASTDRTPPAQVTGLVVSTISSTQLNLVWNRVTATDFNHYNIYRGTSGFTVTPGVTPPVGTSATTSYSNTGLSPSTKYSYRVAAVDNAGNIGSVSSQVSNTTAASTASTDRTPPTVTSTSPASGATSIAVTSPIKATFSEAVQSWSSSTIFTVKNRAGTSFSGTIGLSTDHKTVTFSHSSPFASHPTLLQ